MARMTYSPEKCESLGPNIGVCNGEHTLPDASAGMKESGKTNDTTLVRGICPEKTHYESSSGACEED